MFSSLSFYGPRYIGIKDIAAVPPPKACSRPSRTLTTVIPSAGLRYRHLSEMRPAVCLIFGSVVVLWQEGDLLHSTAGARRGQTVPYTDPDNCHSL